MMHPRKTNPRAEFLAKQRERTEQAPILADKFPRLKTLTLNLSYFDSEGVTKNGEMKCKLNVQQAKSVLWFACRGGECSGGGFDLTEDLAKAAGGRRKQATGELRCDGQRKRGDGEKVPCQALLRYKMTLNYD